LVAVAVFGAMLNGVFQSALNRNLDALALPLTVRADIDRQRSKLAGIETGNVAAQHAIKQSFVSGYRTILWVAVSLAIASSLSAAALISSKNNGHKQNIPATE